MAPSDGRLMMMSKVLLSMGAWGAVLCSKWVSADLSCMIGNLDFRERMKEYPCREYINRAEIERSRLQHEGTPAGHYHTSAAEAANTSQSKDHLTFISPPNVSVSLLPRLQATSCYIFKYQIVKQLEEKGEPLREVSIHANFSCDYQSLCQDQPDGTSLKRSLDGVAGELFCCNKDNCNTPEAVSDLPPRQQLCYNATYDGTTKKASLDYCTQFDTRCARARRTDPGREEALYFCDNLHHCQNHNLTSNITGAEMCKMVMIGAKEIELCCCGRSKCYVPEWLTTPSVPPPGDSVGGGEKTTNPGLSWLFIGGLVLMALVSAAIISMVWMVVRHCRQKARENIMTLTYTRLTVSVPDPEREDVQVLLE